MASVRIIRVPPGEAPAEIRQAWVGLELPLARKRPTRYLGSGVLTGPKNFTQLLFYLLTFRLKVQTGYVVPVASAIDRLALVRPEAARWWREHAPHVIRRNGKFIFAPECCEFLE